MTQYTGVGRDLYGLEGGAAPRERLPLLCVPLGLFIIGAVGIARVPGLNWVVWATGLILGIYFIIFTLRSGMRFSPESILLIVWLSWSLTGVFAALSSVLFWAGWYTMFQICAMAFIVFNFTTSRKTLSFALGALLIGAFIVSGYSYLTGEYTAKEAMTDIEQARVAGLAMNANSFGWIMVLATMVLAYFWMIPTRWPSLKYVLLAGGMAISAAGVLASASRMGLVGLVSFYAAWLWFCYRKSGLKQLKIFSVIFVGAAIGGYILVSVLTQGILAERFGGESLRGARDTRVELLLRGLDLIQQYPLTGVGLGNFEAHYSDRFVAHSEYAEVGADTGCLGAALYFGIFVILWWRCGKIIKHSNDAVTVKVAGLIRAILVVVAVTNLGHYNYDCKESWVLFGSLIGYTHAAWRQIRDRLVAKSPANMFGVATSLPANPLPNSPAASQGR